MQTYPLEFKPFSIVCREGDPANDIFYLKKGKLLICTISGTEVKAIARISAGEFIGELSFFDGRPRAGHIITLEESVLIQIPKSELSGHLPLWYLEVGKSMTKKIRLLDQVIKEKHLRLSTSEEHRPLTIEEQRSVYSLLNS